MLFGKIMLFIFKIWLIYLISLKIYEYKIFKLNATLDDLLSFAKSSDEMSSFLPSIEAYRLKYGVEY